VHACELEHARLRDGVLREFFPARGSGFFFDAHGSAETAEKIRRVVK
jgi:hypothetical protein